MSLLLSQLAVRPDAYAGLSKLSITKDIVKFAALLQKLIATHLGERFGTPVTAEIASMATAKSNGTKKSFKAPSTVAEED